MPRNLMGVIMAIWQREISLENIKQRNAGSMVEYLEIEFIEIGDDFLMATMPVNAKTVQPLKILHGGASCVLAETVASVAANYTVKEGFYCVGSEISASHLRPVTQGIVTAVAKPIRIGHTQQVWNIDIFNEQCKQICVSRMTATVLKAK